MPTHHFKPGSYFTTVGGHQPMLRIQPGDTVAASTVDAHGLNERREEVLHGKNPLAGPFYVESAEPGDALSVYLKSIKPNRTWGWSARAIAPNVVEPGILHRLPKKEYADWEINTDSGTATLLKTGAQGETLTLPLAPMLGCIAVAPKEGQVISTLTSAEHGGNMDFKSFKEGATVLLPVFERGALLYIGDVHALQGDGEISGSGVEVSADVQFTVNVMKGKNIRWPRAFDEQFMYTFGNARPLEAALQHAVTEMLLWLEEDCSMDYAESGFFLGFCASLIIGNVFNPNFTMACALPRKAVEAFQSSAEK